MSPIYYFVYQLPPGLEVLDEVGIPVNPTGREANMDNLRNIIHPDDVAFDIERSAHPSNTNPSITDSCVLLFRTD